MENIEKIFHTASRRESDSLPEEDVKRIKEEILNLKKESESLPDSVNMHLKGLDDTLLLNSLTKEDLEAYKKAFGGEWHEKSKELEDYEKEISKWEKREKQDSSISQKLKTRRQFATMIRHYLVNKAINQKLSKKESHKHV